MEHKEWFVNRTHEDPTDWEDGYEMRNRFITTVSEEDITPYGEEMSKEIKEQLEEYADREMM
jgi:hypothetical protein